MYTSVVFKTEDSGMTWDTISTTSTFAETFNNIDFLNSDTGFVSSNHYLYRTIDGGQSLTLTGYSELSSLQIHDLHFNPAGVLFLVGRHSPAQGVFNAVIYQSADLGETWLQVYSDTLAGVDYSENRFIEDIDFPTAETGYAVGGNGTFIKTTDAGLTWDLIESDLFPNLITVDFLTADLGYINNLNGIYKTTDGGENWESQYVNGPQTIISDIQFVNQETGYASAYETLYKTTNGGITSVS